MFRSGAYEPRHEAPLRFTMRGNDDGTDSRRVYAIQRRHRENPTQERDFREIGPFGTIVDAMDEGADDEETDEIFLTASEEIRAIAYHLEEIEDES
jgi:hypothetical protein